MSEGVASGSLIAIPFDPNIGPKDKVERIAKHLMRHPLWFGGGTTDQERLANIAWLIEDSANWKYEIWKGGRFLGMLLLNRVVPKVDAIFHFTLFDGYNIVACRQLIRGFLDFAFDAFQLQRISVEVPENADRFVRFLRSFGFRYENELDCSKSQLAKHLSSGPKGVPGAASPEDAAIWLAKIGSRRELAHWDGTRFRDLLLLRLLRTEFYPSELPGETPGVASDIAGTSDESRRETSTIPAIDASRNAGGLSGAAV